MWLLWTFILLCCLAAAVAALSALGARRWASAMQALGFKLDAARVRGQVQAWVPTRYDARELEGLPPAVQRYFRAVLTPGQPIIAAATIDLAGRFNMSPTGAHWKPFTSRHRVVTRRPGFLWNAQVTLFPGVPVQVVDSYIAGAGLLRAALLGIFTVAELQGGGEIARGELMRYFAEAAWYPTALLPSQGVQWASVSETSACATMVDGPLVLTLLFSFDSAGLIASVRAEARGAMVGKNMVMLPWEGRWSDYQERDGMWVPTTGEAAWLRPEGRKPYFMGTVTALALEFSR